MSGGRSGGARWRTRRTVLEACGGMLAGLSGCLGSPAADTGTVSTTETEPLTVTSEAMEAGGDVPSAYTCDGEDRSPPLDISGVPEAAAALAIVLDDPDAPGGTFRHWLLWDLPPATLPIPGGVPAEEVVGSLGDARQGRNDFETVGYRGPCPPSGEVHTYRFRAYALDEPLGIDPGATAMTVLPAIEIHRIAYGELPVEYG